MKRELLKAFRETRRYPLCPIRGKALDQASVRCCTDGVGSRTETRDERLYPRGLPESAAPETTPSAECSATSRTAPRTHACAEAQFCVEASR